MKEMQQAVYRFLDERPAMKAHDTPHRIISLMKGEVDELLAEMQWGEREPAPEEIERVRLELADVVIYCLSLGNLLGISVEQAVRDKVAINEERYPACLFQEGDFDTIYLARKKELAETTFGKVDTV